MVGGMNFTWCGQSCGSTSRAFVHESIYDAVLDERARRRSRTSGRACRPTGDDDGRDRQPRAIRAGAGLHRVRAAGRRAARHRRRAARTTRRSRAASSSSRPCSPTCTPTMRIAREEIFGPVLADPQLGRRGRMLDEVNAVEYGLTCSIWTNDLATAHRTAAAVRGGLRLDQRGRARISSARRSAATSSRASAARSASTSCSPSRRRRTST